MLLKDKTALITGSNRGIGLSILIKLMSNGCNIIAHTRNNNQDFIDEINESNKDYNVKITFINFDITDSENLKKTIFEFFKSKIKIDFLINCAGIIHGGIFQMTPIKTIKDVFDVNFFGLLELTQYVSKYMIRFKDGVIINISSVAGIDLGQGNCAYGTSKAALNAFSLVLSKELSRYGIRVNVIAPSLTNTDMGLSAEATKERELLLNSKNPFERIAEPNEIADLVYYLCSDKASFINGQVIRIDGGNNF